MTGKRLKRNFYNQKTLKVAKELLGKFLIHKIGRRKLVGMITEIEAYVGPKDKASHASRGRTPRTEIMFGEPGRAYIYLIYGMYYCFNIVTERQGYPAAVLIRAVKPAFAPSSEAELLRRTGEASAGKPYSHKSHKAIDGPGKVCQYMRIDKKLNGADLVGHKLWVEDCGVKIKKSAVKKGKRIGVDYAGQYKNKHWRFFI